MSGIVLGVALLASTMALVADLAWASRRLLGLPIGAPRGLIAGSLGFAVAYVPVRWLQAARPGHAAAFFTLLLGVPLIVAMIFIVAAEAVVPSGTGPGPVELDRETHRAVARSRRNWQISRIAVRHGLGHPAVPVSRPGSAPPAGQEPQDEHATARRLRHHRA